MTFRLSFCFFGWFTHRLPLHPKLRICATFRGEIGCYHNILKKLENFNVWYLPPNFLNLDSPDWMPVFLCDAVEGFKGGKENFYMPPINLNSHSPRQSVHQRTLPPFFTAATSEKFQGEFDSSMTS